MAKAPSTLMQLRLVLALVGGAAVFATPAAASDCAGDYLECLSAAGATGTSDTLHEQACYAEYWACVGRQLLTF